MEEKNKKKQKKNKGKKTLAFLLVGLFVMAFATAGIIQYYGSVEQEVDVTQPIKVNGEEEYSETFQKNVTAGESYLGNFMHVTNDADSSRDFNVKSSYPSDELDVVNYKLETLEDSNDEEQTWGDGLKELDDELEVSVSYEDDKAVFKAEGSSDYDYSQDMMTFAFDTNANGEADFQVQYNTNGEESWQISYVEEGSWSDWKDVPEKFVTDKDEDEFTLKLPISELGGVDSSYKFGVDADGQNSGNGQTFYSADPEKLWHNGETFTSSDNYVSMDVGTEITDTEEVSGKEEVYLVDKITVDPATKSGNYTVTTEILPA